MSAAVATGCWSSCSHGVSVVPITQYRDHGMTNRTDFSVCRISPTWPLMRSRGTTMWMPLDARTRSPPSLPASASVSSVQTPVALMTARARTVISRPVSRSWSTAPFTAPVEPLVSETTCVREAACAPYDAAVRTSVETSRESSTDASQYWTAPTAASCARSGNFFSMRLRDRCRCSGIARRPGATLASVS